MRAEETVLQGLLDVSEERSAEVTARPGMIVRFLIKLIRTSQEMR